jgi:site-specific recombinase XerD
MSFCNTTLNAAQTLRVRKGRGTHQGLRDYTLIATLLGTGLRVSEFLAIDVAQYHQRGFGFCRKFSFGTSLAYDLPLR